MQRHLALAGLYLAVCIAMIGMSMAGVAMPQYYIQLSGSINAAGWLSSCFAVSYMVCQYPAGFLADRFGYRCVLALGFLLMAAAAGVFLMADSAMGLYLGRFLQGAGEAPVWASAPALLGRLYPEARGRVMGGYNAIFHFGMILGPIIIMQQSAVLGTTAFTVFAWLCIIATILVVMTVHAVPSSTKSSGEQYRLADMTQSLKFLASGIVLCGAVYGLVTSSIPVHLATSLGLSQHAIAIFYIKVFSGIAVAQSCIGSLSDRYGRSPFFTVGLALLAVGLWGLLSDSSRWFDFAPLVFGFGLGTFTVSSLALVNESVLPGNQGKASGYYYLIWGCGYFLGPLVINAVGITFGGNLLIGCLLGTMFLLLRYGRRQQERVHQS
ncbi:MFS transporter [Desulfovibrio inopinatus]|uniref:MFS transporter n=1 Tax=Desulfovibrio inopinatus TaxID=102109 RepID=UPI0004238C5F|nr:MFS transporter [Desulfovibrio inopinatus]